MNFLICAGSKLPGPGEPFCDRTLPTLKHTMTAIPNATNHWLVFMIFISCVSFLLFICLKNASSKVVIPVPVSFLGQIDVQMLFQRAAELLLHLRMNGSLFRRQFLVASLVVTRTGAGSLQENQDRHQASLKFPRATRRPGASFTSADAPGTNRTVSDCCRFQSRNRAGLPGTP